MEVYIEYVILDNLIINYILLRLTNFTLKLNAKKSLCVLSSAVGTIVAVCLPLIPFNFCKWQVNLIFFIIKICLGLVMVLLIKKYKNFKQFLVSFFLFLTYTFVFGGLCFAIIYSFNLNFNFSGLIINGVQIPVSVFVLIGVLYLKILILIITNVRHKQIYYNYYFDVTLSNGKNKVLVTGFLDSGNQVFVEDKSVVVINLKTFIKLYPQIGYEKLLLGDISKLNLKNAKYVDVQNATGNNKMLVFTLEELQIVDSKNKVINLKNQMVGIAKTNFYGKFDCLLNSEIFL